MLKTFRYRLFPTATQRQRLETTLETCRRFYNDGLSERRAVYELEGRTVSVHGPMETCVQRAGPSGSQRPGFAVEWSEDKALDRWRRTGGSRRPRRAGQGRLRLPRRALRVLGERLGRELTLGNFGENLTTEGLLEDAVHIGDEFRVGTSRLVVTQPRLPCFKLGIRFDDPGMVKTFLRAGKPGIYFAVVEEGEVGPEDPIERLAEDGSRVSVAEMFRLVLDRDADPAVLRRLLGVPSLAAVWRQTLEERLGS